MFGFLTRKRARKVLNLEAKLSSPTDCAIWGEVEIDGFDNGTYRLEVEFAHPGEAVPSPLELRICGRTIGPVPIHGTRTEFIRTSRDGPLGFDPAIGQTVELVSGQDVMLAGVFEQD